MIIQRDWGDAAPPPGPERGADLARSRRGLGSA